MLKYNLNNEQYNVLAAMAYSIADIHHMRERYPAEDEDWKLVYKTDVKSYLQHKPGYNITFR